MPLRPDLLEPIPGDNPSGANMRYDPLIEKIKEARREDIDAPQGAWKTAVKTAEYPVVIKLAGDVIAKRSKDLQLAVWLVEAHIRREGLAISADCFRFINGFLEQFWDTFYPELEDGDAELRAGPLEWLGSKLDAAIRFAPVTSAGFSFVAYQESRTVGYEDEADDDDKLTARAAKIEAGKIAPEQFDESVEATPIGFYGGTLSAVNDAMAEIEKLSTFCEDRFGAAEAPGFTGTRRAFEDVAGLLEQFLRKKGGAVPVKSDDDETESDTGFDDVSFSFNEPPPREEKPAKKSKSSGEATDQDNAADQLAAICSFLRTDDDADPAPYMIMRAYQWGKLRKGAPPIDPDNFENPPTELRVKLRKLYTSENWDELILATEEAMNLSCTRTWIDLHRYAILALEQKTWTSAAAGIRAQLRGLLQDFPELLTATLMDDTPAVSTETRSWIDTELQAPPAETSDSSDSSEDTSSSDTEETPTDESTDETPTDETPSDDTATTDDSSSDDTSSETPAEEPSEPAAPEFTFDSLDQNPPMLPEEAIEVDDEDFANAIRSLKAGNDAEGVKLISDKLANAISNRGRFRRRTQLAHLLVDGGHPKVAEPLLDRLATEIEERKLDEWEENEVLAYPLELLLRCSAANNSLQERRQELYERLCRLDPVRAMKIQS